MTCLRAGTGGLLLLLQLIVFPMLAGGQVVTTNRNPVGMEHNLLFNAQFRYTVSQSGSALLDLRSMFDGKFQPSYTELSPSPASPTVITIDGLPNEHTQMGAIVGWSTRWWPTNHFKIEGYNSYGGVNQWVALADFSSMVFNGNDFSTWVVGGAYTKLRFTFYSASGENGRLGVSELFFIHPEATAPYSGILPNISAVGSFVGIGTASPESALHVSGGRFQVSSGAPWDNVQLYTDGTHSYIESYGDEDGLFIRSTVAGRVIFPSGSVGIGTTAPTEKLSVNGKIRAKEVIVDTNWADYVFADGYKLQPLREIAAHIREKRHLPGVPSAADIANKGVSLGEMQAILLSKIEELTLHQIELHRRLDDQQKTIREQQAEIAALKNAGVSTK